MIEGDLVYRVMKKIVKQKVEQPKKDDIENALLKKAVGYTVEEILEEYTVVDNEIILSKKKKNIKDYPPDLSAIKLVLENYDNINEFSKLSREELLKEKERLLKELKEIKN